MQSRVRASRCGRAAAPAFAARAAVALVGAAALGNAAACVPHDGDKLLAKREAEGGDAWRQPGCPLLLAGGGDDAPFAMGEMLWLAASATRGESANQWSTSSEDQSCASGTVRAVVASAPKPPTRKVSGQTRARYMQEELLPLVPKGSADSLGSAVRDLLPLRIEASAYDIDSATASDEAAVSRAFSDATAVFFRGGSQARYLAHMLPKHEGRRQISPLLKTVRSMCVDGKSVGGTSAGAHIQSAFIIAPDDSVSAWELLDNPFKPDLGLFPNTDDETGALLDERFLPGGLPCSLVTTHFTQRARVTRLLPMLARLQWRAAFLGSISAPACKAILGVGIDPDTALTLLPAEHRLAKRWGPGRVWGDGVVHLFRPTEQSRVLVKPNEPALYTHIDVVGMDPSQAVDLSKGEIKVGDAPELAPFVGTDGKKVAFPEGDYPPVPKESVTLEGKRDTLQGELYVTEASITIQRAAYEGRLQVDYPDADDDPPLRGFVVLRDPYPNDSQEILENAATAPFLAAWASGADGDVPWARSHGPQQEGNLRLAPVVLWVPNGVTLDVKLGEDGGSACISSRSQAEDNTERGSKKGAFMVMDFTGGYIKTKPENLRSHKQLSNRRQSFAYKARFHLLRPGANWCWQATSAEVKLDNELQAAARMAL